MLKFSLTSNPSKKNYTKILDPIRKIVHLFALHASHPLYKSHQEQLNGIIDIVDGLEYHIRKIRNYEKAAYRKQLIIEEIINKNPSKLPKFDQRSTNYHPVSHETVAYINRLGQVFYFFKSKWFTNVVEEKYVALTIPSILALMPLRHKHTAHRQQDFPRKGDCHDLWIHQYGLFPTLTYPKDNLKEIRIHYSFPILGRVDLLEKYHPDPVQNIEIFGDNNKLIIFEPTKAHLKLLQEILNLLEQFFTFKR